MHETTAINPPRGFLSATITGTFLWKNDLVRSDKRKGKKEKENKRKEKRGRKKKLLDRGALSQTWQLPARRFDSDINAKRGINVESINYTRTRNRIIRNERGREIAFYLGLSRYVSASELSTSGGAALQSLTSISSGSGTNSK